MTADRDWQGLTAKAWRRAEDLAPSDAAIPRGTYARLRRQTDATLEACCRATSLDEILRILDGGAK